MNNNKLFQRDFTMIVIGQIISLFGNAVLRFALPLYLLNQTGSAALFGVVSALSFIPVIILSPIGGIIADRVNKRNVMVILDFSTAGLTLIYTLLLGNMNLVILTVATLIFLYGIQGAYQPSVQASIPALMTPEQLMPANSVVTLVNSLSGLIGPVIGGAVFGFYGIKPVLIISIFCFFASAVMEIFIRIPFEKKPGGGSIFHIAKEDMKESIDFIRNGQSVIIKMTFIVAAINLTLSALLIVGTPVIITQHLGFSEAVGNRLYGYCEGAFAAGGLIGGLSAGVLSKKLDIRKGHLMFLFASAMCFPIGLTLYLNPAPTVSYAVILVSCFFMMIISTILSIQMMAYLQRITPQSLIGKVMALVMSIGMVAAPLGQALYGVLFDAFADKSHIVFFAAAVCAMVISLMSRKSFKELTVM